MLVVVAVRWLAVVDWVAAGCSGFDVIFERRTLIVVMMSICGAGAACVPNFVCAIAMLVVA